MVFCCRRRYLVTRNPRPHLPPDTKAIITEVNFSVTRAGLEGQLLGVTLQNEKPELEKQKSEMLQKEEECKVQISGLESKLLLALASSEGNLLENKELIDTLTETKVKAQEIQIALDAAQESSVELDKQRMVYQPFAAVATRMYFLVQKMVAANHMCVRASVAPRVASPLRWRSNISRVVLLTNRRTLRSANDRGAKD